MHLQRVRDLVFKWEMGVFFPVRAEAVKGV